MGNRSLWLPLASALGVSALDGRSTFSFEGIFQTSDHVQLSGFTLSSPAIMPGGGEPVDMARRREHFRFTPRTVDDAAGGLRARRHRGGQASRCQNTLRSEIVL